MADVKANPIIDVQAQTSQANAVAQKTAIDIHKQMDVQDAQTNAAVIAREAMGGAEQTMSNQQNAFLAASDAKSAEIRATMGADPTLQGSLSNVWMQRVQENAQKAYDTLDVIKAKQSATLLSDPIGFINAQFTLPADIEAHNYYAERHNIARAQLDEITASSDANVIAAQRARQHTSTEFAIAEAEKAAQGAAFDVAKLKSDAAGKRIVGLGEIDNLTQRQLQNVFQAHAAANSDASLELQRQNHADMMQMRKDRLDDKKDADMMQDDMRAAYNAGAARMNKPIISDLRSWRVYYATNSSKPGFQEVLGMGQDITANGGVTNGIPVAGSAGKAALVYAEGSTEGLKGNQVGSFLAARVTEVKSQPNAPKDREALAGMISDRAIAQAKSQLAEIRPSVGNIYAAPPPSVVLDSKAVAANPFIATTVSPIIAATPTATIDDDTLVSKAFDYAKQPGGLDTASKGIAAYYQAAVLKNKQTNQYVENSLPPQSSYNVRIDGRIVDLSDAASVKKALFEHNMPRYDSPFGAR